MFSDAYAFNQDIGSWNVSSAVNMHGMFKRYFIQSRSKWLMCQRLPICHRCFKVHLHLMGILRIGMLQKLKQWHLFYGASKFNGKITEWNVSSVTDMNRMFYEAKSFNQDISNWNTSLVASFANMFTCNYTSNCPAFSTENYSKFLISLKKSSYLNRYKIRC